MITFCIALVGAVVLLWMHQWADNGEEFKKDLKRRMDDEM